MKKKKRLKKKLAQGYSSNGQNRLDYPVHFGTAAGMISSVLDIAKYSIAIDENFFYSQEIKNEVFTPATSNAGKKLPYGLGWFIQQRFGKKIIWHYGHWTAISSLIIKIQEKSLAFIILANNDMISRSASGIGTDEDVTRSDIATEFLNRFVFTDGELPD